MAQCNTFLLHRISNDIDQEKGGQVSAGQPTRDFSGNYHRCRPNMPYCLGASELPVLVRMNDLAEHERPHSEDPDFWNVWTGKNDKK